MALESSFGSSYLVLGRLIHETCGDDQLKIEDELASLYWVLPSRHEPRLMVFFMVFQLNLSGRAGLHFFVSATSKPLSAYQAGEFLYANTNAIGLPRQNLSMASTSIKPLKIAMKCLQ